jgi:hypothetical protein
MGKKLLITTSLVLTLGFTTASAEEVVTKVTTHKTKKIHRKHHNDAYSPKAHLAAKHHTVEKKEEVMVFAEVAPIATQIETKKSDDLDIKVKGKVDLQYGLVNQRQDFKHPINTNALPQNNITNSNTYTQKAYGANFYNENALVTNGEVEVTAAKTIGSSKYGAGLVMNANPSPTSGGNTNPASKVFLFMEGDIGRFEAGALDGASHSMSPSADRIAKATGGIDGDFSNWMTVGAYSNITDIVLNNIFITSPALPYASQFAKKANKVNFYSNKMNGFQMGVGFTRDTDAQGTTYSTLGFKGKGYKNVIEGGLSYEGKMGDNSLTLSAVGQLGQARPYYVDANNPSVELKTLGAWEIGGRVQMDKITLAASYGDWDKSGTMTSSTAKKIAKFWTAGAAYDHKDLGLSLTYMNSERKGGFDSSCYSYILAKNAAGSNAMAYDNASNKYQALSLGAEYKLMPGLTPYAEVTGFEYKSTLDDVKLNKGAVFLGGIKLNF